MGRSKPAADHWGLTFDRLSKQVNDNARAHGWWDAERNNGEMIALMHSELSEALEAERHGNPPSDHIPKFSGMEEEFADVIIRIMDNGLRQEAECGRCGFGENGIQ